jgi:hypothetical protein
VVTKPFLAWTVPYLEYWFPLAAGVAVVGLVLFLVRVFSRRAVLAPPPALVPEELSRDFDPFSHGSASEKRVVFRRGGNPVQLHIAPEQTSSPVWHGWVVDRSVTGLCINMTQAMEPGTVLRVLPINASETIPWIDIEVRNCRQVKDGFELGCQFVKQPHWSHLLLFG